MRALATNVDKGVQAARLGVILMMCCCISSVHLVVLCHNRRGQQTGDLDSIQHHRRHRKLDN